MPPFSETPALISLLRHTTDDSRRKSGGHSHSTRFFKMFKLLPMLSSGCKMVALLGRHNRPLLTDRATTITLFGHRKGRLSLAIQEDTRSPPIFLIELPMQTTFFHKEMSSGLVKLALESETRTHRRKLVEEFVWAVYCNGRKSGYSIRRKDQSDNERYVLQLLRGVSMGAGVLPCASEKDAALDGELTYMRARFERVVGSKDSEAFYMINPYEGGGTGGGTSGNGVEAPELSVFLVRVK
ncbi:protein MIZU-KUSSEI 1 [Carex littledalei]|uniref:Protein MIZU-KUSSEI 1 n=1 Tax=Carex littledalei TaxID=544730 RepID=A0A833RPE2_9POAL|nr:protein MIZU-KUSSEI 1 [Carex littledalei]